jgi:hypothetical protein
LESSTKNDVERWNAGSGSFDSTVQPGGIWRSPAVPSAQVENAAARGQSPAGAENAPGTGNETLSPIESGAGAFTSGSSSSTVRESVSPGTGYWALGPGLRMASRERLAQLILGFDTSEWQSRARLGTGGLQGTGLGGTARGWIGYGGSLRPSRLNGIYGHAEHAGAYGKRRARNRSRSGQQLKAGTGNHSMGADLGRTDRGSGAGAPGSGLYNSGRSGSLQKGDFGDSAFQLPSSRYSQRQPLKDDCRTRNSRCSR